MARIANGRSAPFPIDERRSRRRRLPLISPTVSDSEVPLARAIYARVLNTGNFARISSMGNAQRAKSGARNFHTANPLPVSYVLAISIGVGARGCAQLASLTALGWWVANGRTNSMDESNARRAIADYETVICLTWRGKQFSGRVVKRKPHYHRTGRRAISGRRAVRPPGATISPAPCRAAACLVRAYTARIFGCEF